MSRLFFGVALPDGVKQQLADWQHQLQQVGVRAGNWSAADLFHITVLFLGELAPSVRLLLNHAGEVAARQAAPFSLSLSVAGAFERNRILWVGLQDDEGYHTLGALQQAVTRACEALPNFTPESRPYRPHITLARKLDVRSYKAVSPALMPQVGSDVRFPVDQLCLFESLREDGRLVYPVREAFPLRG